MLNVRPYSRASPLPQLICVASDSALANPALAPDLLLGFGLEGPGNEATLLLPLGHFHDLAFQDAGLFQRGLDRWQVRGFRHQRAEPQHFVLEARAFGDRSE